MTLICLISIINLSRFFSGFEALIAVTLAEYNALDGTVTNSFVLSPMKTITPTPAIWADGYFELFLDARGLNKLVTVSQEQSTFGLNALFAALLSIFNISLTFYVFMFPTSPLVVSHTYFRFKPVAMLDPTKLKGEEDAFVKGNSPSGKHRQIPKDEVASPSARDVELQDRQGSVDP